MAKRVTINARQMVRRERGCGLGGGVGCWREGRHVCTAAGVEESQAAVLRGRDKLLRLSGDVLHLVDDHFGAPGVYRSHLPDIGCVEVVDDERAVGGRGNEEMVPVCVDSQSHVDRAALRQRDLSRMHPPNLPGGPIALVAHLLPVPHVHPAVRSRDEPVGGTVEGGGQDGLRVGMGEGEQLHHRSTVFVDCECRQRAVAVAVGYLLLAALAVAAEGGRAVNRVHLV
mmetsp:Transcript_5/g.19  ORF Transcript_5/g.19 Transcript_5/m.19 type:complete len:227 (-) Transcript_5:98-778(-)